MRKLGVIGTFAIILCGTLLAKGFLSMSIIDTEKVEVSGIQWKEHQKKVGQILKKAHFTSKIKVLRNSTY